MKRLASGIAGCAIGIALAACGEGQKTESTTAPAATAAPAAQPSVAVGYEAKTIFETRCYTCHGMSGQGDGPGSAGLNPKPRNFTDPAWQTSVTDDHINKIILYGGAAVGRSPMMPGNPDLIAKPAVVTALVQHVRSLSKAP